MTKAKKPRVGVDVDGVLADLMTPMLTILSEMRGDVLTIDDVPDHDINDLIPKTFVESIAMPDGKARSRRGVEVFWERVAAHGCGDLAVYPGAIEGMRELERVADVYIVTSHLRSGEKWVHQRDGWLKEHFGIPHHRIIHTAAKHCFHGLMLVDDKPHNIERWAEEDHGYTVKLPVLWEQPYNRKHEFSPELRGRVLRTRDWSNVVENVEWNAHEAPHRSSP